MERMVSTQKLKIGMYISGLDRPWLDTPFLTQGYFINDATDVEELQKYCKYIYIDIEKGIKADTYLDEPVGPSKHYLDDFLDHGKRQVEYEDQKSTLHEFPAAESALEEATLQVANLMDNARRGDNLDVQAIRAAVQPLLDSIIRNVDALQWMLKVQDDKNLYTQATNNCTLGIAFGRHLGLYKEDIRILAMGMLLLDVGKLKISAAILNKPGALSKAEFAVVKKHVAFGVKMLGNTPGIDEAIIKMVQTHHERVDGSGYPLGLEGKQIPPFGLIAAIIDTYNAMTSQTPYRDAIAPHKVLQELYKWRNKYFQAELVEQFLQCLGVYPTGSLVEMTSGEVGIVIAQNLRDRLKPTIRMLLDEQKNIWEISPIIDMATNLVDASGIERKILRALKPGAYGIDSSLTGVEEVSKVDPGNNVVNGRS
ncbi:MAG: HD-GYP domain-containing protein [Proteobacteria bacterium]|nr:HD-GYP domain-containing protein [Pseudomonadota bacterium]